MKSSIDRVTPVLHFWKTFDLDSKRLLLDSQGLEIQETKEESLKSRKRLAEDTRTFRKKFLTNPSSSSTLSIGEGREEFNESKQQFISNLLKSYQDEIDKLSKRSKYAENAFFSLYKSLYEAPDPAPVIEALQNPKLNESSNTKVIELEKEIEYLKKEIKQYDIEFKGLKNQEITIRELEEKVATFDEQVDKNVQEKLNIERNRLEQEMQEKIDYHQDKYQEMYKERQRFEKEVMDYQSMTDQMQSELFELRQLKTESHLVQEEAQKYASEEYLYAQELRIENQELRRKIDEYKSEISLNQHNLISLDHHVDQDNIQEVLNQLRVELDQKEYSHSKLQQEWNEKETMLNTSLNTYQEQMKETMDRIERKEKELVTLQMELQTRPSVDEYQTIIKKLKIFQQLEYNIVDGSDELNNGSIENDSKNQEEDMEKILLKRIRRIENELHQNQRQVEETSNLLKSKTSQINEQDQKIQEQNNLIKQLEDDLASKKRNKNASSNVLSNLLEEEEEEDMMKESLGNNNELYKNYNGMLKVITAQRDRFRARINELENEKTSESQKTNNYIHAMKRLEKDNIQLYQKIRYLQSYKGTTALKSSSNLQQNPNQLMEQGGGDVGMDVETRYQLKYDEGMNPFAQFNSKERQQRYGNLNAIDKILLTSANMILGHVITRSIAFIYAVILHFLVFATLYTYIHRCGISNQP